MQDPKSLTSVAAFHHTFQHPVLDAPQVPAATRCQLRISLLAEELRELEEGVANQDIVEIADALCDLQYVLSGAILEFGLADKFAALFDEVQRSNMSKACSSEQEALDTIQHYRDKDGTESYYKEVDGRYLVYRQGDDKTLKSINYSPADLRTILSS